MTEQARITINHTGNRLLVPGLELSAQFPDPEWAGIDAPEWIAAGSCCGSCREGKFVWPPLPQSVRRGA